MTKLKYLFCVGAILVQIGPAVADTPSQNACDNFQWEKPIQNLPDVFLCDEVRAVKELSSSRIVEMRVDTVAFKDNFMFAIGYQRDSFSEFMLSSEVINTLNFSDALAIRNNARQIEIRCAFQMPVQREFRQGDVIKASAKLLKYNRGIQGDIVVLFCK